MAESPKRWSRRRFDDDFKAEAVRLVLDEGKSEGSVGRLQIWVERARADRAS